ncbi:MAG: ATP-binding protein [Anaerovibrio sp.]|nr:ATP-binding protein [Anaerovibrio sp.]
MNRDYLKEILADQKENYLNNPIIHRDYALEDNVNYCFVGIRRTGKSYTMYQQIRRLLEAGVAINEILYVNFEDERLLEINGEDLNQILSIGLEIAGENEKPYIFLDEIQNVPGWEKFVRRLADMKYEINITGSNSRMLSREIASTLGGRFMAVQIYPYSFSEYLTALGKKKNYLQPMSTADKSELYKIYTQYIKYGGFPELVDIKNKRMYLNSIYQTIYIGDIVTRNGIKNDFAVRLILKKIAESVMKPISYSRLTNILKSTGAAIGKQTVINYIGYIMNSYLLFKLSNYAGKIVDKEALPKYYFMDTGLLGILITNPDTAQLENLVAIELVRRYGNENVYYYKRNVEVDFFIPDDNLAIQVSYSLLENYDTRERELHALTKLHDFMPDIKCIIITNSEEAVLEHEGIRVDVVPIWKWILKQAKE